MQTNVAGPNVSIRPSWLVYPGREFSLSLKFIAGDLSSTVVPASLFIAAAWHSQDLPMGVLARSFTYGVLYFWLYAYVFCLSNQLTGIEEDRINKPHRPLVVGAVSIRGAQWRWIAVMGAFTIVGWLLGVLPWAVLWQIVLILHNFGGWARRWYGKNLAMSLGIVAQLAAAWQLVGPLTPMAWRWIVFIAAAVFVLISIQDLRDLEGDRREGRRTFPVVFGEQRTRWFLAASFALLPIGVHSWLLLPLGLTPAVLACDLLHAILSLVIAARVLVCRSPQADHQTYLLFTYWYCLVLGSAIVVM
jgi:4-hydroxybenzoate polyprenyltransferase